MTVNFFCNSEKNQVGALHFVNGESPLNTTSKFALSPVGALIFNDVM